MQTDPPGDKDAPDFRVFGHNVRGCRVSMGWTMEDLAERSGIGMNTLARIQRGEPCYLTTQEKIAGTLNVRLESLWRTDILTVQPFYHHRDEEVRWSFLDVEEGRLWPLNDAQGRMDPEAIQLPEERNRLGGNGLSRGFISTQRSLLASGLYANVLIELYGRHEEELMEAVSAVCYRCLRGEVRIGHLDGESVILRESETLVLDTTRPFFYEAVRSPRSEFVAPLFFGVVLGPRTFGARRPRKEG